MITAASIICRVRPPGTTTWTDLTGGPGRADVSNRITATWGRATPRDHAEPGAAALTIIVDPDAADAALLVYDTAVAIDVILTDGTLTSGLLPIVRGWIQDYTRSTRSDGRWVYQVNLMDILGRAAATTITASDRPVETINGRLAAINAASAAGPLVNGHPNFAAGDLKVLAREIDADALSLIQDSVPFGYLIDESDLTVDDLPRLYPRTVLDRRPWTPPTAPQVLQIDALRLHTELPAAAVQDTPRAVDRTGHISQVTYRVGRLTDAAIPPTGVEHRNTVAAGAGGFSTSRLSISTDAAVPFGTSTAYLDQWAADVIAEASRPTLRLAPGRILLEDLDLDTVEELITLDPARARSNLIIQLVDAPPGDVDTLQVITAATLILDGARLRLDDVTLSPAPLFGIRPLTFADIAAWLPSNPTFPTPLPWTPVKLSDLAVVTATAPQPA